MSQTPKELHYAETHEWIRKEGNGELTIGITDHAQDLLGDLVFVELPTLGAEAEAGKELAVVESVKAAADIYSPVDGEVVACNEALGDAPELINTDPYGEGWILRLRPTSSWDPANLLDAAAYASHAESETE